MTSIIRRSPLRSKLALTTALAGGVLGFSSAAQAQSLPVPGDVISTATNVGGQAPIISNANNTPGAPNPDTLQVDLRAVNTIINWNGFNVPVNTTANFSDANAVPGSPIAVLNRDLNAGTNISDIQGSITSDSNVAVWVMNPNGILIGSGAVISTGSFVATALNMADNDFTSLISNSYNLASPAASTATIEVQNGAMITTAAGNRGLILVAPQINADGTFDAGNHEVAFITASDVTLSFTPGSPLGVTLNEGTAVTGASQVIRGDVSGRSVYFALASQAAVTDALLDVGATVVATTAALSSTGIVLAAGTATGPVTLAGGGDVTGVADITVNGSLTATGPVGEIAFEASGDIAGTATASASQGFVAAGQAVGLGAITAGDAAEIDANGVFTALSISGENGVQILQAGAFTSTVSGAVVSSAGGFTADGGTATEFGSIDVDGDIDIGGTTEPTSLTVNGTTDTGGTLTVRTTDAQTYTGAVAAAGAVDIANTVAGNITLTGGLISNGSTVDIDAIGDLIASGTISGADAVTLEGATMSLGNVTSDDDFIELTTISGALSAGDLDADNDITVTSAGSASLNGNVDAGDHLAVTGTTVALGDGAADEMRANGTVVIEATTGAVSGSAGLLQSAVGGGGGNFLIIDAATNIALGGTALNSGVSDVGLNAGAGSTITTGGVTAALLGDANGTNSGVLATFNHDTDTAFGDLTITDSDLDIELTAGSLTTGDVDVTNGSILMTTVGALVAGNVVGEDSVTLRGGSLTAGDVTSTTQNVVARSLAGNLSVGSLSAVTDSVDISSVGGSVSVAGNVTADTDYLVDSEGDVNLGVDPGAKIQQAGGLIRIDAQGTLTGGSGLTLRSGTGDITLRTQGLVGGDIVFAADSLIQGGPTGIQRDVIVLSRTLGNSVVLGDVSARSLLGEITGGPPPSNGITRDASITVDQVNLVNTLALTSNMGNVTVGGVSLSGAGQGITLQAPTGTLTAPGALSASGNIVVSGLNALAFGSLTSTAGAVSANSTGGTLTVNTVEADTTVNLVTGGGGIFVDSVTTTGGNATLSSGAGISGVAVGALTSITSGGDVNASASGFNSALLDTVSAQGNVTIGGISVSANALEAITGSVLVNGGFGANLGTIEAGTSITVNGLGVNITGDVTANGGGITIGAGTVTLGNDPDAEVIQATGAVDITATSSNISGGPGLTIRSDSDGSGGNDWLILDASAGAINLAGSTLQAGPAGTAAIGVNAVSGATITLGDITAASFGEPAAGHASIGTSLSHDAALVAGNVTLTGSNFIFTTTAGDVTVGNVTATGIGLGSITGNVITGDLSGIPVGLSIFSGGTLTGGVYTAGTGVASINAVGDVNLTSITSGTGIGLVSSAGGVTVGDLSGTVVTVSAATTATISGSVTASAGDYRVTAASVVLGGDPDAEVQRATGVVDITASTGAISGGPGLTLRSDSDGTGGNDWLVLDGSTGLQLAGTTLEGGVARTAGVGLRVGSNNGPVELGDISAASVGGAAADRSTITNIFFLSSGDITLGNVSVAPGGFFYVGTNIGNTIVGDINAGDVTFGTNSGITATGNVTADTGSILVAGSGATTGGAYNAVNAIQVIGGNIDITSATTIGAGVVFLQANAGSLSVDTVNSAGTINLTASVAGADVLVDSATAVGNVTVNASDEVRGNTGARASLISTGGDVSVTAGGVATLGTARANQNLFITAASIDATTIEAVNGSLMLNATGAGLVLGNVDGETGVTLIALGDLTVAGATSGSGVVSLTSNAGNTTLGTATAATDVIVSAALAATVTGDVTAGNDYTVRGGTVSLGAGATQQAAGAIDITSLTGGITGGVGLTLASNTDGVGGALDFVGLDSAAGIAFGDTTIIAGTPGQRAIVGLRAGNGQAITLGDVAGGVSGEFDDALHNSVSNLTHDADFTIGDATLNFLQVALSTGSITTGDITTLSNVNLTAQTGAVTTSDLTTGSTLTLSAANAVTSDALSSAGTMNVTGGSVDIDSAATTANVALGLTATNGDLRVGAVNGFAAATLSTTGGAGDVRVDTATAAGLLTINSVGGVRGGSALRADLTSTGGAVAVTATGAVNLGAGLAATDFGVTGSAIDATTLTATGGALTLNAGAGGITLGSGSGLTAAIGTTGAATIATGLNTTGNSSVSAASAALAPIVSTTGSVSVTTTGGDYTGFGGGRADISAGTDITLAIAGNALIGTLDAGGAISATATSLDATAIDAVGVVSTATPGATIAGTILGSSITATGGSIAIGTATSGGLLDLSATAGNLTLTTGTAAGLADIDATGSVLIGTLTAGSALIDAGTTLDATLLDVTGALTTTSMGATTIATIDAGTANITGGSIDVADVTAAATLDMVAIAGDLVIGTGTSGGQMTLAASNDILFTTLDSGAGASLTAGGDILGDMLSAVGAASTNSGGLTDIGALNATGISITSAMIDIASISTPGSLALTSTTGDLTLGTGSAGTSATLSSAANLDVTTSLTAGGLASATAVGNATIGAIASSGGDVVVTAVAVDIGTASANGLLDVSATGGDLLIGTGTVGGLADLDATGEIDIGTLGAGSATLDANGAITLGSLTSGGTAALVAGGALDATNISATGATTTQSGGATTIGTLSGSSIASTGTSVTIGTATAGTTLAVTASAGDAAVNGSAGTTATIGASGDVLIGTGLTAGGATTINAGRDAWLAQVTATGGALTVTATTGQVSGAAEGTRANLTAGGAGNALTVTAGDTALLGTANGAGGVTVNADAIDATSVAASGGAIGLTATAGGIILGTGSASGNAGLTATGAVGVGSLSAANIAINGASATTTTLSSTGSTAVTATGAAALGTTSAGSSVAVTANGITAGTTSAGTTLSLTSGGGITLAAGTAGGNATFDAVGTASLGAVTAGAASTLRVRATDVAITGTQRAGTIELVNRTPATAMRLGDDTAAGGFALNNTELGLLEANTLTLDGGSGAVEIGTLTFDADAGRTAVNVLTTGQIDIGGTVSGTGTGRLFRFGGDAAAAAQASTIRIVTTSDAGGRLLFGTSDVELRGQLIVMGLGPGFLDAILGSTPLSPEAVTSQFISNPNSALYNPAITGQLYTDKDIVVANSLTVRFSDYALFQNTEAPGLNGGAVLGGTPATPVTPALTIDGANSAGTDGFALFGTINGVSGSAASLLGPSVIVVNMVDLPNARVNGCLIGSGAGCLTSVVVQPTLNVFDSSRLDVLRAADDLSLPFDPVVGSNNEALFSGVSSIDVPVTGDECEANPDASACKASEEETVQ